MAVQSRKKVSPCKSQLKAEPKLKATRKTKPKLDLEEPNTAQLKKIANEKPRKISTRREGSFDATQMYLGEIGASPLLTAEEEVYFARKGLKGCEASRKRMIESNLRLVVKIARRYNNRGLALLDLIEEDQV